jgi:hypothetical protein
MKSTIWVTLLAMQLMGSWVAIAQTNATGVMATNKAALRVKLAPAAAVKAGAQWNADGGAWRNSGSVAANLVAGDHVLRFRALTNSDWLAPTNRTITLAAGRTNQCAGVYLFNGSAAKSSKPAPPTGLHAVGPSPPQNLRVVTAP